MFITHVFNTTNVESFLFQFLHLLQVENLNFGKCKIGKMERTTSEIKFIKYILDAIPVIPDNVNVLNVFENTSTYGITQFDFTNPLFSQSIAVQYVGEMKNNLEFAKFGNALKRRIFNIDTGCIHNALYIDVSNLDVFQRYITTFGIQKDNVLIVTPTETCRSLIENNGFQKVVVTQQSEVQDVINIISKCQLGCVIDNDSSCFNFLGAYFIKNPKKKCVVSSDVKNSRCTIPTNVSVLKFNSIPSFVINLERCRQKYDDLLNQLKFQFNDNDITNVQRFNAVDGKSHVFSNDDHRMFEKRGVYKKSNPYIYNLSISEKACALSHVNLWKQISTMNCENAIVFEDDIVLTSEFSMMNLLHYLPKNWGICLLGSHDDFYPEYPVPCEITLKKMCSHDIRLFGSGAFAVLLNVERGVKKLLNRVEKYGIQEAIDWFIFSSCDEIDVYITNMVYSLTSVEAEASTVQNVA